jgi:enterochelin esterase-like enzyme
VRGALILKSETPGYPECPLLEPQSTSFFLLLIVVFVGLMWWLAVAKQVVFRILAASLAFIPAMLFGVAAVNKYYDYYQNWNSAIADMTGQSAQTAQVPTTDAGAGVKFGTYLGNTVDPAVARQQGYTLKLSVHGTTSHITRTVYVYLPPQYFQASYRDYRFPAIELLHGFPGTPLDWITVVGVTTTLQSLLQNDLAKPVVLVMPLQCLNQFHGPQDATYLADDLPNYISHVLRVQPAGRAWGVAGYSEGGFCAANLALRYSDRFGYSGVLSGYFAPSDNQLGHPPRLVSPFGKNALLRRENTPNDLVSTVPAGARLPLFWLGVGSGDRSDLKAAEFFQQLMEIRQPGVPLKIVPGGGHTMITWRALIPPMLEWMTPQLANDVTLKQARQAHAAQKAAQAQHKPSA